MHLRSKKHQQSGPFHLDRRETCAIIGNGVYRVIELMETQMPQLCGQRPAKGEQKFGALFTTNGATTGQFNQCIFDQKKSAASPCPP
jgi:hypothetical protein